MDIWLAKLVTTNGTTDRHVTLGSSKNFSSLLDHVMTYKYSVDLDGWQAHLRRETLDPSSSASSLIGEMRDGSSNGVNIFSSHKNTYVDFERVTLLV